MNILIYKPNRTKRRSLQQRDSTSQKSMYVAQDAGPAIPVQKSLPLPPSTLSGDELVSLMRKHRMTIPNLALRVGTTQQRVRQLRHNGLTDAPEIRDWLEAITGQDPGPVPERFRITSLGAGTECCFCRFPLFHDDVAWTFADNVFCTFDCVRRSSGQ
jgi:hypothetical protein